MGLRPHLLKTWMRLPPLLRLALATAIGGGTLVGALQLAYPAPAGVVLLGLVFGSVSGLVAIGLVLVYRASRIVNFAQGDMGNVSALLTALLIVGSGWSFWVALVVGLASSALLGAVVELAVIRRFWRAPRLILTVATIGLAQAFAGASLLMPRAWRLEVIPSVPTPFSFSFRMGEIYFTGNHVLTMACVPLVVGALAGFLRLTRVGIAIRAAAEDAERTSLLGIPVRRMSTVVWVMASVLSALGATLRAILVGIPLGSVLGPGLMLRALAAAVIGRMESLHTTMLAAMGLGVIEQSVFFNTSRTVETDVILFGIILAGLLLRPASRPGRAEDVELSTWRANQEVRPIPRELRRLPEVRWATVGLGGALLLLVALFGALAPPSRVNLASLVLILAIVASSLLVLAGWSGQISLGHMAFVGFGAAVFGSLYVDVGLHWLPSMLSAGLAGAAVAVVIGLPALRIRGLFLAVATLAFALACSSYFFSRDSFPWLLPNTRIDRPAGIVDLSSERAYYVFVLASLGIVLLGTRTLRRSRLGRTLIAARDNERATQALGVNLTRLRLSAFAVSGFYAAFAGALFALHQHDVAASSFRADASLAAFSMVVIGGLGSLPGAVLGAVYYGAVQYLLPGSWQLLSTGIGVTLLLLVAPGGLGQLVYAARDSLLRRVAARRRIAVPALLPRAGAVAALGGVGSAQGWTPRAPARAGRRPT